MYGLLLLPTTFPFLMLLLLSFFLLGGQFGRDGLHDGMLLQRRYIEERQLPEVLLFALYFPSPDL